MALDFTLETYRLLLQTLRYSKYKVKTVDDYLLDSWDMPCIILRHDVDKLPLNSLKFARLEQEFDMRATYYFRIVKESYDEEIMKNIILLNHEIAYHYEDLALNHGDYAGAYRSFKQNLDKFRSLYPVSTISMHGSPLSKWDNRLLWSKYDYKELGIIGEPYMDFDFSKILYLTDTGRSWNGENYNVRDKVQSQYKLTRTIRTTYDLIELIRDSQLPDVIMLNTHPQRWHDNTFNWGRELVLQSLKNQIKRHVFVKKNKAQLETAPTGNEDISKIKTSVLEKKPAVKTQIYYDFMTDTTGLNLAKWRDFVQEHPKGNPFISPEFYNVCLQTPDLKPMAIAAMGEQGNYIGLLVAVLQKKDDSIPARMQARNLMFCQPLVKDHDPEILIGLLSRFETLNFPKPVYTEILPLFNLSLQQQGYLEAGYERDEYPYYGHNLAEKATKISDAQVLQNFNDMESARSRGAYVVSEVTNADVVTFYHILQQTAKEQNLPDSRFFLGLLKMGQSQGNIMFFLAKYAGEVKGGVICVISGNSMHQLFSCSLADEDFNAEILSAWSAIEWAAMNGYKFYDISARQLFAKAQGKETIPNFFGGEVVNEISWRRIYKRAVYEFSPTVTQEISTVKQQAEGTP